MNKSIILAGCALFMAAGLSAETLPYKDANLPPEERARIILKYIE